VLPKTQRNLSVLFRIHFTTIRGSEIHISLKLDADAGVDLFSGVQDIISVKDSESNRLGSAHASTTYGI
jgi:hypothetical protein